MVPKYGPGDKVSYLIDDSPTIFTVREVHHKTKEYKITSNTIKPVTVFVGWDEIDGSND
jgi:hypothetical protein